MRKTKLALLLCPVLSCGPGNGTGAAALPPVRADNVFAGEGIAVTAKPVENRALPVFLGGTDQFLLDPLPLSGAVEPGDTLARLMDPVGPFLESRTGMELALARVRGDTAAVDSLEGVLASPPWIRWVVSPLGGQVSFPAPGALLNPGDTLALIFARAESLWVLSSQVPLMFWPPLEGVTTLEFSADTALVRGVVPGDSFTLPGTWTIPGTALRESGLRIFVLSASGDSITVTVMGETGSGVLVHCGRSLDSLPLVPWAAGRE